MDQRRVDGLRPYVHGALKFVTVCGADNVSHFAARAQEVLGDVLRIVPAEIHVEFLHPDVNKGSALRDLVDEDLLPRFAAMGDNVNDIEMLTTVGHGIAMANAKPVVKAAAKKVSAYSNDDDAVAIEIDILLSQLDLN